MLPNFKVAMFSWLVIPALLFWLSTNYIIGLNRHPAWEVSAPKETPTRQADVQSVAEIKPISWNNEALITLWFDDAWLSQFTIGYPYVEEKGLKGALAVPTGMVGYDSYMSWSQIKLLQYKGWEITSHTIHHSCNKTDIEKADYVENELKGALNDLNAHGLRAQHFVTPCGLGSDLITQTAKKYYVSLRTSIDGFNTLPVDDPYALKVQAIEWNTSVETVQKWIYQAKKDHTWLILMFHQLQNKEERFATRPKHFYEIIDLVQNSGVKVILPTQALHLIIKEENTPDSSESAQPVSTSSAQKQ